MKKGGSVVLGNFSPEELVFLRHCSVGEHCPFIWVGVMLLLAQPKLDQSRLHRCLFGYNWPIEHAQLAFTYIHIFHNSRNSQYI